MCRNIKQLRGLDGGPTDEQLRLTALQYVRKVTGYRTPSKANAEAFDLAVAEIAESTRHLLSRLVVRDHLPVSTVSSPNHLGGSTEPFANRSHPG
jgi:hypothetical protein